MERVSKAEKEELSTQKLELLLQLEDAPASKGRSLLVDYLKERVAKVLEIQPDYNIDLEKPLNEMGLNSLMNIDLKNRIDTEIGVDVPIEMFIDGANITDLANLLLQQLASKSRTIGESSSSNVAVEDMEEIAL